MEEALSLDAPRQRRRLRRLAQSLRACTPTRAEAGLAVLSAALLILSFPDFNLWPLAWVALVPLLVLVARRPQSGRAFLSGWLMGTLFFYCSCYWLTYAMIRYGEIPAWIAYPLLLPGALVVGLFPALCMSLLARTVRRWGVRALFVAPVLWAALEWARLGVTGQLWNAVGYAQAYAPALIQPARWGGVYAVSFLILTVNAALAYLLLSKTRRAVATTIGVLLFVAVVISAAHISAQSEVVINSRADPAALLVAVQPNVPMDPLELMEMEALIERHRTLSAGALQIWDQSQSENRILATLPRVVVWPESPMYFKYAQDSQFRDFLIEFTKRSRAAVIFNSQEPAPGGGSYNAAVMVDEEARLVAQYDKIRLLPFGEYVPLPRWVPGVSSIPVLVGDFTPGVEYPLMPVGQARAGVFICFESAFPSIARRFAQDGADVLINISNDGYLGRTPVMRQHLANTVFRAVENARPVARVTNTGITAFITARGEVLDATDGFQTAVRTWTIWRATNGQTFYTRRGDLFVITCVALGGLIFVLTFFGKPEPEQREAELRLEN